MIKKKIRQLNSICLVLKLKGTQRDTEVIKGTHSAPNCFQLFMFLLIFNQENSRDHKLWVLYNTVSDLSPLAASFSTKTLAFYVSSLGCFLFYVFWFYQVMTYFYCRFLNSGKKNLDFETFFVAETPSWIQSPTFV